MAHIKDSNSTENGKYTLRKGKYYNNAKHREAVSRSQKPDIVSDAAQNLRFPEKARSYSIAEASTGKRNAFAGSSENAFDFSLKFNTEYPETPVSEIYGNGISDNGNSEDLFSSEAEKSASRNENMLSNDFTITDSPEEISASESFSIYSDKHNTSSIAVITDDFDDSFYGIFNDNVPGQTEDSELSYIDSNNGEGEYTGDFSEVSSDETTESRHESRKTASKGKTVVKRIFAVIGTVLVLSAVSVYVLGYTVANGPSETFRNMLVLSAMQASATKWVPGLFLSDEVVQSIVDSSNEVTVDCISAEEYAKMQSAKNNTAAESDAAADEPADEWADSENGVKLITASGSTFKAYITLVKDPSRIFVGVSSSDFENATVGMNIFDMVAKYDALVGINGGEFSDPGGMGTGSHPIGLTYSCGSCVWGDASNRTFIGFDCNNRLVVSEGMTADRAASLGIRDAVSFQNNNILIDSYNGNIKMYYAQSNTGAAQRTAIGQREDGTVILIVTDGRTASSIGATHNDMIDMMVSYGAVTAAMLDGGSSAMMYYENFFDKYDFDKNMLDEYQLRGLVNKYKAFVEPRTIPTYFLVRKEG